MRFHLPVLALASFCLLPFGLAQAGAIYVLETTSAGQPEQVDVTRMSIDGKNVMIELPGTADSAGAAPDQFIFLGERGEMLGIDHAAKTYTIMDKETLKAMGDMMGGGSGGGGAGDNAAAMEAMLQEALKDVPAEERAEIEKMMRQQMGAAAPKDQSQAPKLAAIEYRKTKERGEQHGYDTVKYEEVQNDVVLSEMWVTDWDNVAGGEEAREAFKAMAEFWQEAFSNIAAMAGENPIDVFEKINGFPVVDRDLADGKVTSETVLKSAEEADIDSAIFQPPAGYTRDKMGME